MMNTVVGSAIGGLVAGAVALGAAAAMRPSPAPAYGPDPNGAYAMTVANTGALNNGASLQCQPFEEAVLRRAIVAGREVTDVTCITRSSAAYAPQGAYAQPIGYAPQQLVYRDYPQQVNTVTRPVSRARTVSQPARQRTRTDRREEESERSWGKTAMVIGGSSGAGAGIGGLIAGKKGALIGAAVGGGAGGKCPPRRLLRYPHRMPGPDPQSLPNVPLIHRPGDQAVGSLKRPPLDVRKRLLIVDDELPILRLVTRILATDNYEISSAQSGEAAAALVAAPDFQGLDLLVTDLNMGGMNGRQLAAIVRQKVPKTRVLYVTGFADTLFQDLQELGEGESFIEKPFGTEGLLEATRLLMFGHISDGQEAPDRREVAEEWSDERLRAKLVRLLRRLRMA